MAKSSDEILHSTLKSLQINFHLQMNFLMWFLFLGIFLLRDINIFGYEFEDTIISSMILLIYIVLFIKMNRQNKLIASNLKALEEANPEFKRDEFKWFRRFFRGREVSVDDPKSNETSK